MHEALIRETPKGRLIGSIARESMASEARERLLEQDGSKEKEVKAKPAAKTSVEVRLQQRRWKGCKAQRQLKEDTLLHRQRKMDLEAMLAELTRKCSIGVKTNSQSHQHYWRGYKLYLDVADGQIPVSAGLTGAKLHDSQVCIRWRR